MNSIDGRRREGHKREAKSVMAKIKSVENILSDSDRNKLWYPTFRFRQRWYCFVRAPIVIFIIHSVWYFIVAVVFTYFVVSTASPMQWHHSREERALTDTIDPMEVFMCAVFGGKLITEILQLFIQGPLNYLLDLWNTFDILMILGFYCGLGVRLYCFNGACTDFRVTLMQSVDPEDLYLQLYCMSLCFLWISQLRVLSVHRSIGPLVLIFLNMCSDVANFFVMLVFFVIAFSVLIFGSGVTSGNAYAAENASQQCQEEGGMYAGCTTWWWFSRTVLQSFGEFSLEEMTTGISIIWLMILFMVVNLILYNLLIALMSSTFERIQRQSERQWMINHYNSTNEYLRFAMALPSPFNVVGILVELLKFLSYFLDADKKEALYREFRGFTWQRSLAVFLSRNRDMFKAPPNARPELSSSQTERRKKVQVAAFMEHARNIYNAKQEARGGGGTEILGGGGKEILKLNHGMQKMHRKTAEVLNQQKSLEDKLESKREDRERRFARHALKPFPPPLRSLPHASPP
ncbi:hypothetical protein T484DRAFT_2637325 [Baffinella frigidus]|nr:hypothetical protein T484DRAFT_2637325 [Cryptophyta sp. CCMP2293]